MLDKNLFVIVGFSFPFQYAIVIALSLASQIVGKIYASDLAAIKQLATKDVEKTWLEEIKSPGAMNNTQQTVSLWGRVLIETMSRGREK